MGVAPGQRPPPAYKWAFRWTSNLRSFDVEPYIDGANRMGEHSHRDAVRRGRVALHVLGRDAARDLDEDVRPLGLELAVRLEGAIRSEVVEKDRIRARLRGREGLVGRVRLDLDELLRVERSATRDRRL